MEDEDGVSDSMDEKAIEFLEGHIPEVAQAAVTQAYWMALASGCKVLKVEGDKLIEVSPEGAERIIKTLPPSIAVKKGQRLKIQ